MTFERTVLAIIFLGLSLSLAGEHLREQDRKILVQKCIDSGKYDWECAAIFKRENRNPMFPIAIPIK